MSIKELFQNRNWILAAVLASICVFFTLLNPLFLSPYNLSSIIVSVSVTGVMACGMTLVIIAKGIDLSLGSVLAASGIVAAGFLGEFSGIPIVLPLPYALLLALVPAAAFGLLNGWLITQFNVPPFIVTLGTMGIVRGIDFLLADSITGGFSGLPVTFNEPTFEWLGNGSIGPFRFPAIVLVVTAVIFWIVLHRTVYGRHIFAIGHDTEVARKNGVPVARVKLATYVIMGLLAGVGGILLTGRLSSAAPSAGIGYEFNVITAVVLGGGSLAGGEGSIVGTILGVLIMGCIYNGLQMIAAPPFWQYLLQGIILVVAVAIDMNTHRIGPSLRLKAV